MRSASCVWVKPAEARIRLMRSGKSLGIPPLTTATLTARCATQIPLAH